MPHIVQPFNCPVLVHAPQLQSCDFLGDGGGASR